MGRLGRQEQPTPLFVRPSPEGIQYTVIRKKSRKRVAICVLPGGEVEVRAPLRASEKKIREFVLAHAGWIRKQLSVMAARGPVVVFSGESGEKLWYLGKEIEVLVEVGKRREVVLDEGVLRVRFRGEWDAELVKKAVIKWYRELAREIIEDRVLIWSERIPRKPVSVKLKTMRSRWGSCSSLGNLNFNWVLIMAPLEVLDYVVVHELCHLVHMNHSKSFWKLVGNFCPDFRVHVMWLREFGEARLSVFLR